MNAPMKTARQLESYVAGEWVRGAGKAVPLLDAATGDAVALIDASGIDFKAALTHGREVGSPALRNRRMGGILAWETVLRDPRRAPRIYPFGGTSIGRVLPGRADGSATRR